VTGASVAQAFQPAGSRDIPVPWILDELATGKLPEPAALTLPLSTFTTFHVARPSTLDQLTLPLVGWSWLGLPVAVFA